MRSYLISLLAVCFFPETFSQEKIPVFVSGTDGHKSYRIPAIIGLPNGELLAFCEGRVNGAGDFGDINIVLKRSVDKGKTWSALQTVVDYDAIQAGNPAPVVDLTDPQYPEGRIFLFYNTGNNHEGEVRKGNGLREVWSKSSVDGGVTWMEAINITVMVHRPKQPHINPAYDFPEDWRSYANTPGHAVQFTKGKFRGRIFVAANHSAGDPKPGFRDYAAHGFYTDDHGKTFQLGESVGMPGSNESTATDLSDGTVMMNIRNQRGDIRERIVALSTTGGTRWDTAYFDPALPDPVCEGSILAIGKSKGKNILAFTNAADPKQRDNLTLRISFDNGRTWKESFLIDKGGEGSKDYTAYSDLVNLGKNTVGILYERNNYSEVVFVSQRWKKK